jgi:hypothetical protein
MGVKINLHTSGVSLSYSHRLSNIKSGHYNSTFIRKQILAIIIYNTDWIHSIVWDIGQITPSLTIHMNTKHNRDIVLVSIPTYLRSANPIYTTHLETINQHGGFIQDGRQNMLPLCIYIYIYL